MNSFQSNTRIDDVREQAEKLAKKAGLDLIELKVTRSAKSVIVRVIVDFPDGGVTIRDCASLNRALHAYIESARLFGDDFTVEVNSPGLKRKLTEKKDFVRNINRQVMIWFHDCYDGKTYTEGRLQGVTDAGLLLIDRTGEHMIPFNAIKTAKQKI